MTYSPKRWCLKAALLTGLLLFIRATAASSLLMTGGSLSSNLLPGMALTPDGRRISFVDIARALHGQRFQDSDVVEFDLITNQYRVYRNTLPFDVLVENFTNINLLRSVAVHTTVKPRFLVGYGRSSINALGTMIYVGRLNYNSYKEVHFNEAGQADFDEDGITDTFENDNELNPFDPDDALLDQDGDWLDSLTEFNSGTDPNDPDSDGDGIGDALDRNPVSSNLCSLAEETFNMVVTASVTCAANISINVVPPAKVQSPLGDLLLISPSVKLQPGFRAGRLTVISSNPCPGCP